MVARAAGEGPALLAREAAGALAAFGNDPAGLVTACRRLVDRQPTSGPMWWLAARVLGAGDPANEAWRAADDVEADPTPDVLRAHLPDSGTVTVVGWGDQVGDALRRWGALEVMLVDTGGRWTGMTDRLARAGVEAVDVPESGLAAAVVASSLVLLDASALGPDGFVAAAGSYAAAAVARDTGVDVWVVAGVGRVLPGRLWDALVRRLGDTREPWLGEEEVVPLRLADRVIGPAGAEPAEAAVKRADCPVVPELLKGPID